MPALPLHARHADEAQHRPIRWARWLTVLPCVAAAFYLMWMALCLGASNLSATEAAYIIDSRITQRRPLDAPTLDRARALLENALAWNAANSTAHETLAQVHYMRLGLPRLGLPERREALDLALQHILAAAALRPTSGYTYALAARFKQMRGERDAMFHKALAQAVKYSPWEPRVQDVVIDVGSRAWSVLDETEREAVRQTIVRALSVRPEEAGPYLLARRWVLPPCEELKVKIPKVCK